MKTTSFIIRILICFLLSLVPVSELENRIYSTRIQFKFNTTTAPQVIIFDKDPSHPFEKELQAYHPLVVLPLQGRDHLNHFSVDSDGVIRRSLLNLKGKDSGHLINFVGPRGTFPRCNRAKLLGGDCPSFKNKIILLNEKEDLYPSFSTPVGDLPFAELVANDLQTVLLKNRIVEAPVFVRLLIHFLIILIEAFIIIFYPVLVSAVAISGMTILIVFLFFQLIFQWLDFYIQTGNMICGLLITYLVFTGYRLAIQENLQWRSLKQAQYLRELDRIKSNFLSLASHDLKTPIAKIQAVVERLRRELNLCTDKRSDWHELIDSIENSNNEMKHYITSILNLSRIESQKITLNKKSNDINRAIQQTVQRLLPIAQQKNIHIEESLEPLFSIECDEDLLRQVLTNLIDNAIKFSPRNSKVFVRSREEDEYVRVEVQDFGPGIPNDQLPLMFRKFSRLIHPMREQVKGTGLGLYLSKYFIELHGGKIRLETKEGCGTTFTFTLPLRSSESEILLG